MFEHGLTKRKYYSVREKINYYNKILTGKINQSRVSMEYVKRRLKELKEINSRNYNESPNLIITDDKHFGNGISKPRLCVGIKEDEKGKVMVAPIHKRKTRSIILDNEIDREISNTSDGRIRWIDKSDIYDIKYIDNVKPLTQFDKNKIREIFKEK